MTSVNSPACLLARNRFYRNSTPGAAEQMKPTGFSCQNNSRQRQVTLCVTMATPPGGTRTKSLWVHIVLGSSSSLRFSTSKRTRPADRVVK